MYTNRKYDKGYKSKNDKAMSYDDVKKMSAKYLLPCKVVYQLHSEFNCIVEIANQKKITK